MVPTVCGESTVTVRLPAAEPLVRKLATALAWLGAPLGVQFPAVDQLAPVFVLRIHSRVGGPDGRVTETAVPKPNVPFPGFFVGLATSSSQSAATELARARKLMLVVPVELRVKDSEPICTR